MSYRKAAFDSIITDKNIIRACDEINQWNQHDPSDEYFYFVGIGTEEEPEWLFNWDSVMGMQEPSANFLPSDPERAIPHQYMECGEEAIVVAGIVWRFNVGQGCYESEGFVSDFEEDENGYWIYNGTPHVSKCIQEVYLHFDEDGNELATGVYIVA